MTKYTNNQITTAIQNPLEFTNMPGLFFSSAIKVDNLKIIHDAIKNNWSQKGLQESKETALQYATRFHVNDMQKYIYIKYVAGKTSFDEIPTISEDIKTRIDTICDNADSFDLSAVLGEWDVAVWDVAILGAIASCAYYAYASYISLGDQEQ